MSGNAQMKILNLCKGQTLKQAQYRLDVMMKYHAIKVLGKRISLTGLKMGHL